MAKEGLRQVLKEAQRADTPRRTDHGRGGVGRRRGTTILANYFFGTDIKPADVNRRHLKVALSSRGSSEREYKLIARWRRGKESLGRVQPVALPVTDPLANIAGVTTSFGPTA